MKKIFVTFLLLFGVLIGNAQILGGFGKKLEDKINRKIEEKVDRHVDKTINKADQKTDEKIEEAKKGGKSTSDNKSTSHKSGKSGKTAKGAKDFVSGTKILVTEDFKQDAIGDFPVNWLTNSSGEVVELSSSKGKWLMLNSKGSFTIKNFNKTLPKNFTFEFNLATSDKYSYYSTPLNFVFASSSDYKKDYKNWHQHGHGKEGVLVNLHPQDAGGQKGLTRFFVYSKGEEYSKNEKSIAQFTSSNDNVRVQVWRQGSRMRVYIDGNKIWDLPDAFQEGINYNSIIFYDYEYHEHDGLDDRIYLSDIVLAEAGADTRHKLIETGAFTTNEILFDTNKATIKPSSEKVLLELGEALNSAPDFKVMIIGHTDGEGKESDNQKLSEKRAESVKSYLMSKFGIDSSRMQTSGKGESQPLGDNSKEEGKAQNRRVEFKKI